MEGDTVLVAAGTYSPSTNSEVFPIEMDSGINLIGSGKDISIIDAQQTSRVITMEECSNNIISDLTITGGLADSYGGGMRLHTSNPIIIHVTISNNTSNWGGGMHLSNSDATMTHVTISNNQALQGGGMRVVSSDPVLTNVSISNNMASESGGMRLFNSNPILTHVTISNNTAEYYGGGMWLDYSDPILTHVTISNNTAGNNGGGMVLSNSNPILTNSIIWGNSPESFYIYSGTPVITYSDIESDWEGEGNIDNDPLFNEDYTLQAGSPCINTGTIILGAEYCGEAPDLGAYEYITEDCYECGAALADVTGDGQINILDLVQIVSLILEVSTPDYECAADYNGDGEVNILDLVQIVNYILNP